MSIDFKTYSSKQTKLIAGFLAKEILDVKTLTNRRMRIKNALTFALNGNLGVGKTTFVQGFMRGAGIKNKIISPTFILMKKYEIRSAKFEINSNKLNSKFKNIYHLDCYRIKKPKELLNLGLKEILENLQNIVLIEWPKIIKRYLPKDTIWIEFKHGEKENQRTINFKT